MQIPDLTKVRLNNVTAATATAGFYFAVERAQSGNSAIDGKRIALYGSYCSSGWISILSAEAESRGFVAITDAGIPRHLGH